MYLITDTSDINKIIRFHIETEAEVAAAADTTTLLRHVIIVFNITTRLVSNDRTSNSYFDKNY